jgi:hypothetical protein
VGDPAEALVDDVGVVEGEPADELEELEELLVPEEADVVDEPDVAAEGAVG